MSISTEWRGDELNHILLKEMEKRLKVSAELVRAVATKKLRVSGWGLNLANNRGHATFTSAHFVSKSKKIKGKTRYYYPSLPGEPPHADTGTLSKSVFYQVYPAEAKAIVGTAIRYGRWLETGTPFMKARPWLRPSLYESMRKIQAIFAKPLPSK